MFQSKTNECVGFESKWKVKKVSYENETQTTDYSLVEVSTTTAETAEIQTQTDLQTESTQFSSDVDYDKLSDFLKKMYPLVKQEIDEANNSQAFKDYRLSGDDSDKKCKRTQNFEIGGTVGSGEGSNGGVSAIAWNCTGNTLAVSCNFKHDNWCYHAGFVSFYALGRDEILNKTPTKKLGVDSCVNVICFHPAIPFIVAVGLYSGNFLVWNLQHDDGNNVVAKISAHEEGLTQLSWVSDTVDARNLLLISSSLDGYLCFWNFSYTSAILNLKQRCIIKSPLLQSVKRNKPVAQEIEDKVARGILAFDFSRFVPDQFVVGVEGGLVVECSLSNPNKLKGSTPEVPILDPVFKFYEPHEGEIINIAFSPNRKDMFLTNGTDAEIRIYTIGQSEPSQVIFLQQNLNTCLWIPFEEKLLVGAGQKAVVELFHLISGRALAETTDEKPFLHEFTQIAINKARSTLLAVGTQNNFIQIWKCPWNLFRQ